MGILTRWHKLRDAISDGNLSLAVNKDKAVHIGDVPPAVFDRDLFERTLDWMETSPRFIVPSNLIAMVTTDQAMLSLTDMLHCGVLGLPFEACVIEFDAGNTRYSVHLSETGAGEESGFSWQARMIASYAEDGEEIAMAFPAVMEMSLSMPEAVGEGGDTETAKPPMPNFNYRASMAPYMSDDEETTAYAAETAGLAFNRAAIALLAAFLLPQTLGLEQEKVSSPKLNKQRRAKGRHAIPDHTVIRVGSYQTASGETRAYDERAPTEVFLRRAHKRRVAVGQGRTGRRWHFFKAQVVGYLPDGTKPTMVQLLASRAAKPYLLKD